MPNSAVPASRGTTPPDPAPAAVEVPLAVVLTCTDCQHTYAPSTEDFAVGRTGCPDPDCGGWVWTSTLTEPATGGAR